MSRAFEKTVLCCFLQTIFAVFLKFTFVDIGVFETKSLILINDTVHTYQYLLEKSTPLNTFEEFSNSRYFHPEVIRKAANIASDLWAENVIYIFCSMEWVF